MIFNDAISIWGAFLIGGVAALAASVLALAAGELKNESDVECAQQSPWFHISILASSIAGVGLAGTVGSLAGLGPGFNALLVVSSAIVHGLLAHSLIRPLIRGENLLEE